MYTDLKFLRMTLGNPNVSDEKLVAFIKKFIVYLNNLVLSVGDELLRKKLYEAGKKAFAIKEATIRIRETRASQKKKK